MAADSAWCNMATTVNAAGIDVRGANNPNWKGGLLSKTCEVCSKPYSVKRVHVRSRFCSLQCVGRAQKGRLPCHGAIRNPKPSNKVQLICVECSGLFSVPRSHSHRYSCCSMSCQGKRTSVRTTGRHNPNWQGGIARLPYPWNFRKISQRIIQRDGYQCQGPKCSGVDERLTAHHINYQKQDCRDENLITLCSACNSKANFGRPRWQSIYEAVMAKNGGGYEVEQF